MSEKKGFNPKNAWLEMEEDEQQEAFNLSEEYAKFITENKTEREVTSRAVEMLEKEGFEKLEEMDDLKQGDKIYSVNREREVLALVVGKEPLTSGMRLLGSHIDSPRLDLKPNPLNEKSELAFLESHYYGGIKKYQWVTIPLALHGVLVKDDGTRIEVNIGENKEDPVFYITDLLIHLSRDQMKKKMSEGITGEKLNVVVGSIPLQDDNDENEKVKAAVLDLLSEKYNIEGEDFVSADLEVVPAFEARDVGFDRGLLAAYGHDDRVCSYAALKAVLEAERPRYSAAALLVDKEEIGSMGSTGMKSRFFENQVAEIIDKYYDEYSDLLLRKVLRNTEAISGDVNAGYDPDFSGQYSETNSAYLGKGIVLTKYTGARGKSGASEASAEFMGKIRGLLNENGVLWQIGEIGKVDKGGGGTIAQFLANYSMDVVDAGPPLLSMHAPYELVSKIDLYNTYLAYLLFLEN